MPKIVLNAEMLSQLPTLTATTLIVDENGNWVGLFTPAAKLQPAISDEELQRRANSKEKGISTAELLASLEKR